jgi:hypothetical protein
MVKQREIKTRAPDESSRRDHGDAFFYLLLARSSNCPQ